MRADLNVQMAKAKAQSAATWSGTELVCAAVQQETHTELCGDDHAPVTRGRMRAQYPLPHGPVADAGARGGTGGRCTTDASPHEWADGRHAPATKNTRPLCPGHRNPDPHPWVETLPHPVTPLSPLHASPVPHTARPLPPNPSITTSARRSHTAGTGASTHDLQVPAPPLPDDTQRVTEPAELPERGGNAIPYPASLRDGAKQPSHNGHGVH